MQEYMDLIIEGHRNLTQALFNASGTTSSQTLHDAFDLSLQWAKFYDAFMGFVYAIEWTETFIIASYSLLALWYLLGFLCLRWQFRMGTTLLLCFQLITVLLLQPMNDLGAEHWRSFANQNYFDKAGVFASLFYGLPLVVLSLIQVVCQCQCLKTF